MDSPMRALAVAIAAFVATNVDDILILLLFFANRAYRSWQVVLGQYLGMTALIALSLLGAAAAGLIPPRHLGLLGLLPLAIGLHAFFRPGEEGPDTAVAPAAGSSRRMLIVAAVTIANGGDNLGVYIPMFAARGQVDRIVIVVVFLLLTGVWCLVARGLVDNRRLQAPIQRMGHRIFPWVMIALGLEILVSSYWRAG
jgi:cadmium resistance protein CadD (predicted permease)